MADLNMATITPSRVNKSLRYGKNSLHSRRHVPGRGEIPRPAKDHSAVDFVRKRKRRIHDRDMANTRGRRDWNGSDDVSDDSATDGPNPRSRDRRKPKKAVGWLNNMSRTMTENPDFAEQAHKLIRLSLHLILVGSFMLVGWKGYSAVHADISTANRAAQAARLNSIAECTKQYQENQCVQNLPALRDLCEQWKNCMTDDPEAIFMVRNTIKEVASIINEFSGEMHLKSWVSIATANYTMGEQLTPITGLFLPRHDPPHYLEPHGRPAHREQQTSSRAHAGALPFRRSHLGPPLGRLQPLDAHADATHAPASL